MQNYTNFTGIITFLRKNYYELGAPPVVIVIDGRGENLLVEHMDDGNRETIRRDSFKPVYYTSPKIT